jgi:arginase
MNIVYFPHKLGQPKDGLQKSLTRLSSSLKKTIHVVSCDNSKNKNNIYKNIFNLYQVNYYLTNVINIGGDHSMAIGSIGAALNKFPNLKVIWFDAHPDINTYEKSLSKNIHGMPLAYLTGLDTHKKFNFIKNKLKFQNLLYIGIRDIDDFEAQVIRKYNIKYIKSSDINNNPEKCMKKILNFIKDDPIHVSFDVDCMDPSIIPSTGTTAKYGLKMRQTKFIIDSIYKKNVVNTDITELNLSLGTKTQQDKSLKNTLKLFENQLK